MSYAISAKFTIVALLLAAILSACQPIQPEAALQATECSDDAKIALLRQWEERFRTDDVDIVDTLFTKDAIFAFDPSPYPDRTSGKYQSPYVIHVEGHEAIKDLLGVIDSLDGGVTLDEIRVQEDMMVGIGHQTSSQSPAFGTPGTEMPGTQLALVRNCKLAMVRFVISQAGLDAMPAEAAEAAARCEDPYKSFVFQRFINGLWNWDIALAGLPWAEDAVFRLDGVPRYDEATKSYRIDPATAQTAANFSEIQPILAAMIEQQTGITPDIAAEQIDGLTLTLPVTITQFNPSPEFSALPLTELGGVYTATFNDQCEVATLDFAYSEETLQRLNEAKTQ